MAVFDFAGHPAKELRKLDDPQEFPFGTAGRKVVAMGKLGWAFWRSPALARDFPPRNSGPFRFYHVTQPG